MITIGATSPCRRSCTTGTGRAPASVPIRHRSYITATAAYGYETEIVYMLAKDGTDHR